MKSNYKATHKILSLLLCITLLWGLIGYSASAEDLDGAPSMLGSSRSREESSLGQSEAVDKDTAMALGLSGDLNIATARELYDFSKKVNSGDEVRTKHIVLTSDINLMELEDWEPIGTEKYPFSGVFEGNNFTISGIGYAPFESLFGYINGATVRNLKVLSNKLVSEENPYVALAQNMVSSSIVNCSVDFAPLTYARAMGAFSNVTPDPSWTTDNTITKPGHLLDLQQKVNSGTLPVANSTITISGTIDMQNVAGWVGIGDEEKPFVGTVTGNNAVITNLTANNPGADNIGLFGYTDLSAIDDIILKNANITGNDNVGALVGTAKRTDITACAAEGGTISGGDNTGGLVGTFMLGVDPTDTTTLPENMDMQENTISYSYSTSQVNGKIKVGGLVGMLVENHATIHSTWIETYPLKTAIDSCFSLGQVSGSAQVGGILGAHHSPIQDPEDDSPYPSMDTGQRIINCASGSLVSGTDRIGGIVGCLGNNHGSYAFIEQCYFSGEVYGFSFLGGIVGDVYGSASQLNDLYTSGYIIASAVHVPVPASPPSPALFPSYSYSFGSHTGHFATGLAGLIGDIQAMPNTIYPYYNKLNKDMAIVDDIVYKEAGFDGSYIRFMDDASIPALSGFDAKSTAGFTGDSVTNIPPRLPDGTGSFPKLVSFSGAPSSVQASFNKFTEITTNPSLQTIGSLYYRTPGTTGKATMTKGSSTAISLPSVSGGKWVLSSGGNSGTIPISDITLNSGENEISVVGTEILIDEYLNKEQELILSLVIDEGSPLSGAKISRNVTFADEVARPLYDGGVPTALAKSTADISKADKMPIGKTSIVFKYDEQINMDEQTSGSIAPLIKITEFSDQACTIATGNTFNPSAKAVLGNAIKIVIDKADLNWGSYYKLELEGRAADLAGTPNVISDVYYFGTVHNQKPVLTFDDTTDLATDPNSSTDNQTQALSMIENSVYYRGITDGIMIENETYIDPTSINYTFAAPLYTLAGQGDYAGRVGDASDFYLVPGTYEVTYTVIDSDDTTIVSDPITRTFRVNGTSKITLADKEIDLFTAELTQSDITSAYDDKQENGLTTEQAIKNALDKKYINTTTTKLSAFRYNYKTEREDSSIRFDTSGIPDAIFTDGIDTALKFYVGDEIEGRLFLLTAKAGEAEYEIRLTNNTFFTAKEFSNSDVKRTIGAYAVSKSTGLPASVTMKYYLKDIDHFNYNTPQTFLITIAETEGLYVGSKDMRVSATATVVVQKEVKYVHPEDVEDIPVTYWEATLNKLRTWRPESVRELDISYAAAEKTPHNFFSVVKNREDITTSTLALPSGIKVSIDSSDYIGVYVPESTYSLAVEPMYDMDIFRDVKGKPVSQFVTKAQSLPGLVSVSIPLNMSFDKDLKLYRINEETGKYIVVSAVSKSDVVDGNFIFETTEFQGRYVVTSANLAGKETTSKIVIK